MESETQLVLGNNSYKEKIIRYFPGLYIFFILGPARTQINLIIQCLGIVASLLSLVKGVAEFHLFTMFNMFKARKEVNLVSSLLSFLPSHFIPVLLYLSNRSIHWLLRTHSLFSYLDDQHYPHLCLLL